MEKARIPAAFLGLSSNELDLIACGFMPEPMPSAPPPPVIPNPGTVKFKALSFAITGGVNQANFPYSWRLSADIAELSRDGWVIAADWVNVTGFPASVKRYRVDLSHAPTRIAAQTFVQRHLAYLLDEDDYDY